MSIVKFDGQEPSWGPVIRADHRSGAHSEAYLDRQEYAIEERLCLQSNQRKSLQIIAETGP